MRPAFRYCVTRFGLAVMFAAFAMPYYKAIFTAVDLRVTRAIFNIRGPQPPSQRVSLIRADKRSYKRLGINSADDEMTYLAQAIERAKAGGAKLVILDYFLNGEAREKAVTERLREALASVPTVIGKSIEHYTDVELNGKQLVSRERILPARVFAEAAGDVVWLLAHIEEGSLSRMSLSDVVSHPNLEPIPLLPPLRKFVSPEIERPGDYDLINYYGEAYSIPDVPLYRVVTNEPPVPEAFFRDRVVLIGVVDLWGFNGKKDDTVFISASVAPMWGVETHATVVANLLDGTWIRRLSPATEERIAAVALFLLFFAAFSLELYWFFMLSVIVFQMWAISSYIAFTKALFFVPCGTVILVAAPVILVGATLSASFDLRRFIRSIKESAQTKSQ